MARPGNKQVSSPVEKESPLHGSCDLRDDDALIAVFASQLLRAAGLDVFANEPHVHPGYRTLDNVCLTPHIGSATHETRDAMERMLTDGIEVVDRGEAPLNRLC